MSISFFDGKPQASKLKLVEKEKKKKKEFKVHKERLCCLKLHRKFKEPLWIRLIPLSFFNFCFSFIFKVYFY
jgi:hypothetical protein